jgi:23S rRNA (uracil1939-C5)-methyltransferase
MAAVLARQIIGQEKAPFARVQAPCVYYGKCGGCNLQDLAYADQLKLKHSRVQQALLPLGIELEGSVVPLEDPWRYRNKAELTFGQDQGRLILGYHAAGSYSLVVDIDECLLMPQAVASLIRGAKQLCEQTGLPAYRQKTHEGFFRHLVVRYSQACDKAMLAFITAPGQRDAMERMALQLMGAEPSIAGIYWGVSQKLADVAYPDTLELLAGEPLLEDRLGPYSIRLMPLSFLQPCSMQADRIYRQLAAWAGSGSIAWDLYCGLGLVSLYLSGSYKRLYGIEVEESFLSLARQHAALNGAANIEFRAGKAQALLQDRRFWLQEAKPDLIVVDPPRAGLHPQVVSTLLGAKPSRIAYLSCNAASLARDLGMLLSGYPRYRVAAAKAFDMFPQTAHVETLVILQR